VRTPLALKDSPGAWSYKDGKLNDGANGPLDGRVKKRPALETPRDPSGRLWMIEGPLPQGRDVPPVRLAHPAAAGTAVR
jgi:hypothetical protein